jgi:hypothetical protein
MSTFNFIVKGDMIELDPTCDISNLRPGPDGYLRAKFEFSSVWKGCTKVAAFFSNLGKEYEPQIIENNNTCIIPAECFSKNVFKVQVIGQNTNYKLRTNKVQVRLKGGRT